MKGADLSTLPIDVLEMIFRQLDARTLMIVAKVSREWGHAVNFYRERRKSLNLSAALKTLGNVTPTKELVKDMLQFFPNLTSITLGSWRWATSFVHVASFIMNHYRSEKLVEFDCKGHPITMLDLSHLAAKCPNIQSLNIARCACVDDLVLEKISTSMRQLKNVNISDCQAITNRGIRKIVEAVRNVTAFRLGKLNGVLVLAAPGRTGTQLGTLTLSGCKRLSGVRLENSLQLREANLSDNVSLLRAVLLGSGLEMLKMSHCTQLQEVELTCPSLKYVQMERSRVLSGSVFNQLNACRQLDSVVVNGGYQVMEIDLELPLLRRADFSGCNHVWRVNIRCPTLESLVLPGRKATISDVKIRCAHDASITPEHPEWAVTVTQSIKEFSYPL